MLEVQVMLVVIALWGDAEELLQVPMPSLDHCQAFARLWNTRLPGIGASCVVVQRGVKITSASRHPHSSAGPTSGQAIGARRKVAAAAAIRPA
jgi:hypothetical protein